MDRLRFGTFLAPFHPAGENPTLALQRDLELVEHLDRLGYGEAWIGEHHSAGTELIASPEIFIAAAAERTRRIKLGTGVLSVPYHNPLWVADLAILLDHLTRGRFMLGVGPGGFREQYAAESHNAEVDEQTTVAHNMYLEVAAELGLPGFALFEPGSSGSPGSIEPLQRLG